MVNAMTKEGNSDQSAHPRLAPEVRYKFGKDFLGNDDSLDPTDMAGISDRELRDLCRKRALSKADMELNLRVLRIWDIAMFNINLVRLFEEEYRCSRIMATSLAVKEIERCKEETRERLREVSHPLDKAALDKLVYVLDRAAGEEYNNHLLFEAQRVGAVRGGSLVHWWGRDLKLGGEPDYELIEAGYALDAIWDGKASKKHGTTEDNRWLAKSLRPKLDEDGKVVEARQQLDIPPSGFKDLEAAYQWARSQDRLADWSRCDDACREKLVWWESFTLPPEFETVIGRGYIMLDVPEMNEAVRRLVDKYRLRRPWYRALPFYLIRGRLEPPKKEHKAQPMKELHQEIYELSEKYKPCLKAVLTYICHLTDEDWSDIAAKYPAANKKRWPRDQKPGIRQEAKLIADSKGKYDETREWLTEDNVWKIRSRM